MTILSVIAHATATQGADRVVTPAGRIMALSGPENVQPVRFRVLADDRFSGERRVVDIGLPGRVDEADLRRIAEEFDQRSNGARLFVNFHLPGGRLGDLPWASATSQPALRVHVIGLSKDDAERLAAEAQADRRPLIGAWLTQSPLSAGRLALLRDGGRVFAEWRLRSGQRSVVEMIETRTSRGQRFDDRGGGAEHYVVTAKQDLEVREGDRLIAVGERIRIDRRPSGVAGSIDERATIATVGAAAPPSIDRSRSDQPEPSLPNPDRSAVQPAADTARPTEPIDGAPVARPARRAASERSERRNPQAEAMPAWKARILLQ